MIFVVVSILILIYLFSTPKIRKAKFGRSAALTIRWVIIVSAIILLTVLIAEGHNIYPSGYWFTKVVFWLFVFSCMSAYGLCSAKYFATFERVIYKAIFFLPLIFMAFLLFPFVGIAFGLVFYVKFIGDPKFILYSDNNIRIEQPAIRFMGPDPRPVIYVKQNLTSFQDSTLLFGYNEAKDKIEVRNQGDKSYLIILRAPDNYQVPSGIDTFFYKLKDYRED